jgi:hypothetical protein
MRLKRNKEEHKKNKKKKEQKQKQKQKKNQRRKKKKNFKMGEFFFKLFLGGIFHQIYTINAS